MVFSPSSGITNRCTRTCAPLRYAHAGKLRRYALSVIRAQFAASQYLRMPLMRACRRTCRRTCRLSARLVFWHCIAIRCSRATSDIRRRCGTSGTCGACHSQTLFFRTQRIACKVNSWHSSQPPSRLPAAHDRRHEVTLDQAPNDASDATCDRQHQHQESDFVSVHIISPRFQTRTP